MLFRERPRFSVRRKHRTSVRSGEVHDVPILFGCAVPGSAAGADAAITTADMNIRFLAPCRSDATARMRES